MRSGILLIGFGGIGRMVFAHARAAGIPVGAVLVKPNQVATLRSEFSDAPLIDSLTELDFQPTLAAECASQAAVKCLGPAILRRGVDLTVISTGALADRAVLTDLEHAAYEGNSKLNIAPGAAPGIEALAAARLMGLDTVTYRLRKPPTTWIGTPAEELLDLKRLSTAAEFFNGDARVAAREYPKSANVACTIALAGAGFEKTEVSLVADPAAGGNVNEIEARGAFGEMQITICGRPLPDNPRTATLAALSMVRAVRNRYAQVVV